MEAPSTGVLQVVELLKTADVDACVDLHQKLNGAVIGGFLSQCGCAYRALEQARRGSSGAKEIGKRLRLSERSVQRRAQIWREIVEPILAERRAIAAREGREPDDQFLLEEQSYYVTAIEAAPVVERPAVELLNEAAQRKAEDPTFSARKWRNELRAAAGDEGSTASDAKSFWRAVKRFATKYEGLDMSEAVAAVDPVAVLDDARDALVQLREAVAALEARTSRGAARV